MIRWLWPILATFISGTALSALLFDRIDHKNPAKKEWSVFGFDVPLNNTLDFFVFATPVLACGLLICALFLWHYAGSQRCVSGCASRLPPVGPSPEKSENQQCLNDVVKIVVATVSMGLGGYASIHCFRHLLKHSVFDHSTDQVFHGPGLMQHLSRWSLSGDLRYGIPEGITYYAGIQTAASLLLLVLGLLFGIWALIRVLR